MVLKETYNIDLDLVYYDMAGKADIKGYYGAISKIVKSTEIEVTENKYFIYYYFIKHVFFIRFKYH